MARCYYSATIENFLKQDESYILGELARNNEFSLDDTQKNAWINQIYILKEQLAPFLEGHLIFEYTIPRVGKRIDNVFMYNGLVFLFEFKVGESAYHSYSIEQVMDYALDLKNFHKESHNKTIVPVLIATKAPKTIQSLTQYPDGIVKPVLCNSANISEMVVCACESFQGQPFSILHWENSIYMPTPTIIEAAQALYRGHNVTDISRSDSGAKNLSLTTQSINRIIDRSKSNREKSICFVTGVPGAGKTLAGLNIANERHRFEDEEHAVFLSGNGPLVDVLQEALARNQYEESERKITKNEALTKAKAFIQLIHHFRDDALSVISPPIEKVVIFDEAQRAWTVDQTSDFMRKKKGKPDFNMSEPEFLISIMDRHKDWAVIVCLIGGGQEINSGEAGLPEWFNALRNRFPDWNIYLSNELSDFEYTHGIEVNELLSGLKFTLLEELHLSVSLRSFRSEKVSQFIKALLDVDRIRAKELHKELVGNYPIVLTRSLMKAKEWVKKMARGSERYGIVASSGSSRLKPFGIWTQSKIEARNWFLNAKDDVRSSYYLEDTATEFDVQGLELDWAIVAWDADLRFIDGSFIYQKFSGTRWRNVNKFENMSYLKNSYRVLLTRARQGMIIFIPEGEDNDLTRQKHFYDGTYNYLIGLGVKEL